jgi:hypothetical protein
MHVLLMRRRTATSGIAIGRKAGTISVPFVHHGARTGPGESFDIEMLSPRGPHKSADGFAMTRACTLAAIHVAT